MYAGLKVVHLPIFKTSIFFHKADFQINSVYSMMYFLFYVDAIGSYEDEDGTFHSNVIHIPSPKQIEIFKNGGKLQRSANGHETGFR